MQAFDYRYEVRDGDEVVATGHLTRERALEIGDNPLVDVLEAPRAEAAPAGSRS